MSVVQDATEIGKAVLTLMGGVLLIFAVMYVLVFIVGAASEVLPMPADVFPPDPQENP